VSVWKRGKEIEEETSQVFSSGFFSNWRHETANFHLDAFKFSLVEDADQKLTPDSSAGSVPLVFFLFSQLLG
jgi:hypothetical protein